MKKSLFCLNTVYIFIVLSFILAAAGCGGKDDSSGETGSLAFGIKMIVAEDAGSALKTLATGGDAQIAADSSILTDFDCEALGVYSVTAFIYNEENTLLATSDPWLCSDHGGEIGSIPSGPGRRVIIEGRDEAGNVIVYGEKYIGTMLPNEVNDAGVVPVYYFSVDDTNPPDGSLVEGASILLEWEPIPYAVRYHIQISESSSFDPLIVDDASITDTFYLHTNISEEVTYYWRVFAVNINNHNSPGESKTFQTTKMNIFYQDADSDGYGNPDESVKAFTAPSGYVEDDTDCNDSDAAINPGAEETYDGVDNNCNGQIDDSYASWYLDADGDGYGNPQIVIHETFQRDGYVSDNTDFDDTDENCYPGAPEIYDHKDNDGDGDIDEGFVPWYADNDGDGYGNAETVAYSITQPSGYAANAGDCNDNNPVVNPGATDICGDGIDQDCSGADEVCIVQYMFYKDDDGDGYGTSENPVLSDTQPDGYVTNANDCDDTDAGINPDAEDIAGDGIDQDCDGIDYCPAAIVSITSPSDGSVFNSTDGAITFTGTATDCSGNTLSGESLSWKSDIDGIFGTGEELSTDALSTGEHKITLTATDSNGDTGSASINITVTCLVEIPTLSGCVDMDPEECENDIREAIDALGLTVNIDHAYNDTVAEGELISITITPTPVLPYIECGSTVTVIISLGEEPITFTDPALEGLIRYSIPKIDVDVNNEYTTNLFRSDLEELIGLMYYGSYAYADYGSDLAYYTYNSQEIYYSIDYGTIYDQFADAYGGDDMFYGYSGFIRDNEYTRYSDYINNNGGYGGYDGTRIQALEGIQYCNDLQYLWLFNNNISDATDVDPDDENYNSPLDYLKNLAGLLFLDLSYNDIHDVSPLVVVDANNTTTPSNPNLSVLNLLGNPIDTTSCQDTIPILISNGVEVWHPCIKYFTFTQTVDGTEFYCTAPVCMSWVERYYTGDSEPNSFHSDLSSYANFNGEIPFDAAEVDYIYNDAYPALQHEIFYYVYGEGYYPILSIRHLSKPITEWIEGDTFQIIQWNGEVVTEMTLQEISDTPPEGSSNNITATN